MQVIYQLFKIIVKVALWVYFPGTKIKNRERLRFKGPAIVVSNHQNTLLDVLVCAAYSREQFHFLANAGLFKSKFGNWFFNTFYCIPVERLLDTNGKPVNNASSFARADQHMEKGGTLYIAPEGTSWMKRHLHPLKTGTARIAFNAESKNSYQLDLKIIPIGLNYSAHTEFRSRLFVNIGEPLYVRDWQELYAKDQIQAVREITKILEERLRPLMIDTKNESEDELLKKLEEIIQNSQPVDLEAQFYRSNELLESLHNWHIENELSYNNFAQELNDYFKTLYQYRINDQAVANASDKSLWWRILLVMIGLPIFLYGYINNFLPAFLPNLASWWLVQRKGLYIGYTSTIKISLGVITFPLFYWLQSELVEAIFSTPISWWYLLSLPITGLFAIDFQVFIQKTWQRLRFRMLDQKTSNELQQKRDSVEQELEKRSIFNYKTIV
ncbi:MAG: 1-acyl-sn-glycerol-3-phosphate acyltransferase [Saprospiraceae bacterium]|nr:1-acyl-sn-glycerol-3-phosphate acyltransferase [Saprospiraceae bacterium]